MTQVECLLPAENWYGDCGTTNLEKGGGSQLQSQTCSFLISPDEKALDVTEIWEAKFGDANLTVANK